MSADTLQERIALELDALREQVAALREEVRRALREQSAEPALLLALFDEFGHARFTSAALLQLAAEEPHSAIGEAVATMIDMNATPHRRATQLGARLARMAGVEPVGKSHGCVVYRVASEREPT